MAELLLDNDKSEEAGALLLRFIQIRDSLYDEEQRQRAANLRVAYETEKKDETIQLLSDLRATDEAAISSQRTFLIALMGFSVVLALGLFFCGAPSKKERPRP